MTSSIIAHCILKRPVPISAPTLASLSFTISDTDGIISVIFDPEGSPNMTDSPTGVAGSNGSRMCLILNVSSRIRSATAAVIFRRYMFPSGRQFGSAYARSMPRGLRLRDNVRPHLRPGLASRALRGAATSDLGLPWQQGITCTSQSKPSPTELAPNCRPRRPSVGDSHRFESS